MPALPMHAAGRETLASRLDACKGIGPGFDSLRLFLALSIVCVHSLPLAHGFDYYDFRTKTLFPLFLALLPMFFGLSGFLVTGSAKRLLSIPRFLMNRGLRIAPALVVEVTLSAIVLGAAVTTLPWTEYFTDKGFYAYFLNIIGNIHFELPGVFKDNPFPATVNGNLWTLQPEYYCYLVLAGAMLLGIFKHRRLYVALVGIGVLAAIALDIVYKIGNPFYAFSSAALVFAFMAGSLLYMCAAYVPVSGWLCAACFAGYFVLSLVSGGGFLSILLLLYVTVYLGLAPLPKAGFLARGDYSYGIYLYGFPIEQALVHYFPALHVWWRLAPVAVVLTIAFSMLSWHGIEKPTLALKKYF